MLQTCTFFVVLFLCLVSTNTSLSSAAMLRSSPHMESPLHSRSMGNAESIFGVRWTLGNSFVLQKQYRNDQRFVLMFNSLSKLSGNVILQLQNSPISCSYHRIPINVQSSYIYRCNVNYYLPYNELKYKIVSQETLYQGEYQNTTLKYESVILYQGFFRALVNRVQPLFVGNFNTSDTTERGMLENQLAANKNINLALLSGSFSPQLNQSNYQSLLLYLQVLSSVVPVVLVSLNQQQNWLFTELFYMPQSEIYQSYFWLLSLPNSLIVMGINPIILQNNTADMQLSSISRIFQVQIGNIAREMPAIQQFFLVITPSWDNLLNQPQSNSHFSEDVFKQLLRDQKVTLYLSWQAKGYFRTDLDNIHSGNQHASNYSFDYPIQVNEGRYEANNNQSSTNYDFQSLSAGFGMICFQTAANKTPFSLSYQHFSFQSGQIDDNFTLQTSLNRDNNVELFVAKIRSYTITIEFMFLLVSLGFITYTYIKLRPSRISTATEHVEMVQEAQDNPPDQLRQPIIL